MSIHLLCVMWWLIVCPTSGVFLNFQKVFIVGAVPSLLPDLTYSQWYTRLTMVRLVSHVTRVYLILSPEPRYEPSSNLTCIWTNWSGVIVISIRKQSSSINYIDKGDIEENICISLSDGYQ